MRPEIEAIEKAMCESGRFNMSASQPMERQFIDAKCKYEAKLRELATAEYALESAARGLVHWSEHDQFQRNESGEIVGGCRAHPDYAEIWKLTKQAESEKI